MRRKLYLIGLAFTVVELGFDALLLFTFFPLTRAEAIAGAISLAPVLAISTLYWAFFSGRWMRGLDAGVDREVAREAVVRFPRRALLYRTVAVTALGLLLAPTLAGIVGMDIGAAGIIAGTIACVGFATNVVRAWAYRRALASRGAELYADEPLRALARCLREQLFVATNIVGALGATAAMLYVRFIVGVPMHELAVSLTVAPAVLGLTVGLAGTDMWFASAPLMPFLVPSRHGAPCPPTLALRVASTAPYRIAGSTFVSWIVAGAIAALSHLARVGLPGEALQVFAGVVAVGVGLVPFQLAWHRRILQPAREAAALSLVVSEGPAVRSRLSLRAKVVVAFVVLIAFGGTFAVLGTFTEHDRFLAAAAGAEAVVRRDALLGTHADRLWAAAGDPAKLAALASELSDKRERVVALLDGKALGPHPFELPPPLAESVRAGAPGYGAVPSQQSSIAFAPVGQGAALGVLRPWRDPGRRDVIPLLFVFAALGFASAGLVLVAVQELTGPLRTLAQSARRMGQGDLASPIAPPDSDEMGELAQAMEWGRRELGAKVRSIEELNLSLEARVRERTSELEAAKAEIVHAEKMASLGRLVAGIAHEINNPLNFVQNGLPPLKAAIDALAQLSARSPAADQVQLGKELADVADLLRVMDNGVSRMGAIVRALRDFSRQSEGDAVEPVELERLVDDAAALLRHELKGRVEVVKAIELHAPLVCQAGPMTQVFMNLFRNAAQAIEGRGAIEVSARAVDGGVEIRVADSGRGIGPEELPKIFEPFFTTKPVGEGTGLGLAIVHGIVEKHRGRIGAASTPGKGSEFTIFLPQQVEAEPRGEPRPAP